MAASAQYNPERILMGAGGLALLYANLNSDLLGSVLLLIALVTHLLRMRRGAALAQAH